jgi:hypothetical protein
MRVNLIRLEWVLEGERVGRRYVRVGAASFEVEEGVVVSNMRVRRCSEVMRLG